MRRVSALAVLLSLALLTGLAPVGAQEAVQCETGERYTNGVQVQLPTTVSNALYVVTAVGLNGFDPVLVVQYSTGFVDCIDTDIAATQYSASLPDVGDIPNSPLGAQVTLSPGADAVQSVAVAGKGDSTGSFLLFVEGIDLSADSAAIFSIQVSPGMIADGSPLTTYLFGTTPEVDVALREVDGTGQTIVDPSGASVQCSDAGAAEGCWGNPPALDKASLGLEYDQVLSGSTTDAALSVPLTDSMTGTMVNFLPVAENDTSGSGVLVFLVNSTVQGANSNAVMAVQGGNVSLHCSGDLMFDNGFQITIPPTFTTTPLVVTAIGVRDVDPVMGAFMPDGASVCARDSDAASFYGASLPAIGDVNPAYTSAQVTIAPDAAASGVTLVVGSSGSAPGEFLVFVEGEHFSADDASPFGTTGSGMTGEGLSVQVSTSMLNAVTPLTAYMLAADETFDPQLTRIATDGSVFNDASGNPEVCDNAGDAASCWGDSQVLTESYLLVAQGSQLRAARSDAMLAVPLDGLQAGDDVRFLMSGAQAGATGAYVVVFHIATQ